MIIGIGTDIIEIERIKHSISKPKFLNKYFTKAEIELYNSRHCNPEILAGNFAIKESISKVFGTGVVGFELVDIEVLRDDFGKPYVYLYNKAKALGDSLGIVNLHVTISHNKSTVVGFAIGEGNDRDIR